MSTVEVRVPDIGDSKDVTVVEVLVAPGAQVRVDDALITLESEKASMDIPSTAAGKVISIGVKKGMKVSMGMVIATVEIAGAASTGAANKKADDAAPAPSGPAATRAAAKPAKADAPDKPNLPGKPVSADSSATLHRPPRPRARSISSFSARDRAATRRLSAPPIWDSRSRSSSAGRCSAACA